MAHALAPNRHIAFVDDCTVILDLAADRYSLLGARQTDTLRALARGEATTDQNALAALHSLGLLVNGEGAVGPPDCNSPRRSAIEMGPREAPSLSVLSVAGAVLRASVGLRVRGLLQTLTACTADQHASDRIRGDAARNEDALIGLAQSYARQLRRLPTKPICLRDSIALRDLLNRSGMSCSLVIAVRLMPFAAHCWLQTGDLLLNDSCDGVSGYTPILVL